MLYSIGDVFIPNVAFDDRRENDAGSLLIAGDQGDVYADYAFYVENAEGVLMRTVFLKSGIDYWTLDRAKDEVEEIVRNVYDSIGVETFYPKKSVNPYPARPMGFYED